jgi:hypothetical protein
MAVINVATYVETFCVKCGMWARTHRDYLTCSCGGQTAKRSEYIECGIEPDVLTDSESF